MPHGSINHLALTASDLARSARFYDSVLSFMGFRRAEVPESTQQAMKTRLLAWASPNGSVTLRPAKEESVSKAHDRNAPGLNHVAFNAESREEVDRLHSLLKDIGVTYSIDRPNTRTSRAITRFTLQIQMVSSWNLSSGRGLKVHRGWKRAWRI
jgi:glyoxylase I family protein